METRPPEPNSTAAPQPPDGFQVEDVTIRREAANLDELAEAKTVISKTKPGSIPAHPGNNGSPAEIARVLMGHHLDHFELQTLIGGGGMGAVFRARDTRLDRTVAIKVIPRVGDDPELQRRFRNEAQSAARLDHPNIARVYDVGQHGGWHYIVFEYIEGTNLRDLVNQEGVLSVDDAVYYTRQVAEALDHASRRGVTHRDIKPSNVLITPSGHIKLVDMGLARAQQLEMSEDMTASGVTLGTFDYISPEQAKDPRDADVRSDIYSLGCTLYFALTGRAPYGGGTPLQKLLSHGSSPLPDPRQVRSGLSDSLVAVLQKMMAKQPGDRYRRPLDLVADLYQLAQREQLPRTLSAGSITVVPANRFLQLLEQHLPWVVAAGLLFFSAAWLQVLSSASGDLVLSEPVPVRNVNSLPKPATTDLPLDETDIPRDPQLQLEDLLNSEAVEATDGGEVSATRTERETEAASGETGANVESSPANPSSTANPNTSTNPSSTASPSASANPSSANSDATSRQGPPELPERPTVVRVVGLQDELLEADDLAERLLVTSLEEAIEAVTEDASIEVIEIGSLTVRCGALRLPNRNLTIRGTSELSTLEFQQVAALPSQRLAMIEVGCPKLDLQQLHLKWRFPTAQMNGGSLFQFVGTNPATTVQLETCSLTIENLGRRDDLFAFEAPTVDSASTGITPLVAIKLSNVIVRGQTSMLSLSRAVRVELIWDNGLLAVSGQMVQSRVGGSQRMLLIMNDVTAAAAGGLVRLQLAGAADGNLRVDREANRCVFTAPSETPLIAIEGMSDSTSVGNFVSLRGKDNYYDAADGRTQVVLRATTSSAQTVSFGIQELLASERPMWVQEASPQDFVAWRRPLPTLRPAHLLAPDDYLQEGIVLPGFRLEKLPRLAPSEGLGAIP